MLWSAMALIPALLLYLLLLLIALYCWFRWSHRELLRAAADLPVTHSTWPILGHSYAAFGGMEALSNLLLNISKETVSKGLKTICFWCGPLPIIMIHDIQDIQTVLNSSNTIDKADEYEYFKFGFDSEVGSLSYSLLTAPGKIWKVTRKHMNPLFHPRNLLHMLPVFNQNSRELVSCLSEHVGHGPFNLMPYTMDIALKTVCNLVFGPGVSVDMSKPDFRGLISVVESIPEMFVARVFRPWLRSDVAFRFFYRKELKNLNLFWNNFTGSRLKMAREISKHKKLQRSSPEDKDDDTLITGQMTCFIMESQSTQTRDGGRHLSGSHFLPKVVAAIYCPSANQARFPLKPLNIVDAYDTLRRTHPEFTDADMRSEMLTFYCTGTDTVGSSVASCLLALAQFPDIQERLYQEVCSVVGPNKDVTLQDLNRMPYLDQVIKETLRWFMTVPYTLRKTTKDLKLSTCNIPARNTIMVSLVGIHMDPKTYPDPLLFIPDRFSQDSCGKEKSTYIPFSGGPRNSIAKTYAMQMMKIMVVHVLRKFKLKTDMDIYKLRKKFVITLVSVDGYNVLLEQRC